MKKLILTVVALLTVMTSAFAQIGSLSNDLVFTPITPCRILDTRLIGGGGGTPIPAGGTSVYYAGGLGSFNGYGGSVSDCSLFTPGLNIAAIAVNFVVVAPSAAGYITAYPNGASQPTASTVNYTAGAVVANSAILKVSQSPISAMSIFSLATTHVVADVTGYYSKPVATALECVTTAPVTSVINVGPEDNLYRNHAFANTCDVGYTEVSLTCTTSNMIYAWTTASSVSSGTCGGLSTRSGYTVSATRRCCRIPGR